MSTSLSKAAYNMSRGIRASAPTVQQMNENMWFARGALRFPQGINVIYNHFAGKHAAEALSHPYFIEKEYWPEQPSPQFHLTEEIQCLLLIMKGNNFSRDDSTHLDNTMTILRNPRNAKEFTLYNPIEVSTPSLHAIRGIIGEGQVTQIIVPSKQTWQAAGEWNLQYPDARIWCSGNVPYRFTKQGAKEAHDLIENWKQQSGWYDKMKAHEATVANEKAEAEQRESDKAAGKKPKPNLQRAAAGVSAMQGGKTDTRHSMMPTQLRFNHQNAASLHGNTGITHAPLSYMSSATDPEMRLTPEEVKKRKKEVEVANRVGRADLYSNEAFADVLDEDIRRQFVAMRPEEMGRHLSELPGMKKKKKKPVEPRPPTPEEVEAARIQAEAMLTPEPAPADAADNVTILDPYAGLDVWGDGATRLLHISGDKSTNEYVLYDAPSKTLGCTDLYHGGFSDYDPMNTWLCRMWFKFQRQGNYKSSTILPSYRRIDVDRNGNWAELRDCVDDLTRAFPIERIIASHGTMPFADNASNCLREMYELPPLPPSS
jgi:hypothetical protein